MNKRARKTEITAKTFLLVFWRVLWAYGFYPLMLGLFLWVFFTDKHWIWGAVILAAIFSLDPIWRVLLRRMVEIAGRRKK